MNLEHAKKQCFAYDGVSGCSVLDYVKTCKGCRFYKTKPQLETEQRLSAKRRGLNHKAQATQMMRCRKHLMERITQG